jgi:hypothetical protein
MNRLCEHSNCELLKSQNKIEKFIEELMKSSLKLLQYKYPKHNKDCLQRIYAERLKVQHHLLLGELIHKNVIQRKVIERNEVAID